MDIDLKGRRAVIVGGTRGIGRAIVESFANEGCAVAFCARNGDQVDTTLKDLRSRGVTAFGQAADAASGTELQAFIGAAARALGGVDAYVSNASGAMAGGNDEESWKRGYQVDILGTMHGCEAALPYLEQSGTGAIVVVGTVSALELAGPRRAYNSVKAAILPYIKGLARDMAPKNVRCNVVSPGQIYFKGGVWDWVKEHQPERFAEAIERNPMKRMGTPGEVADAVVFLASPRASFISGTNLICDGARTQYVQY